MDGEKLKATRERHALSLRELAERAGVSWVTIWRIENGKRENAHPMTRRKLAQALGVEPRELARDGD